MDIHHAAKQAVLSFSRGTFVSIKFAKALHYLGVLGIINHPPASHVSIESLFNYCLSNQMLLKFIFDFKTAIR